ncbi:DUF4374 domain-containing protein [Chitinophaga nivalis]|uniref:DUF4374 domain-containing protein n=1 Tax=Chitinophaga nivalis TaxID=2991709 RepID=A0ABT3IQ52_9BACT|nr:DUF4374 domain-containing protein [Chitinophaga nivalis]MCW3464205.1 DUF4374 domain-containing protein [Chitinophaga nivalis]MCW3486105.1 DUF4374 domain-containing protein [Chitinophaga nivalis]
MMTRKKQFSQLFMSLCILGVAGFNMGCSKDKSPAPDNGGGNGNGDGTKSSFVFVVYTDGSGGEAGRYIVPIGDVTKGTLSTKGVGVETEAYSFIRQNNKLFGIVYAAQGPTTPYRLNKDGKLEQAGNAINTEFTGIYGTVNKDAYVGGSVARSKDNPVATLYRFDAISNQVADRSAVDLMKITANGEMAVWTGLSQVDNKLFVPFYCTTGADGETTKYVDSTWIAVFSYPQMVFQKVIRDGRTGSIGNWFGMQGVQHTEDGDVYAWSTAGGSGKLRSTKPSAIVRIKKGTETFDQSYFFDIEKATGTKLARGEYIANGKFLMTLYATNEIGGVSGGRVKLAIVDVLNKTVNYVSGVPEHNQMSYNMKVYVEADKKTAYYVMKEDDGKLYLYVIDVATGKGSKGLYFQGIADVTSITKLDY